MRPAEKLDALPRSWKFAFLGLFAGAQSPAPWVPHVGAVPCFGKAECEILSWEGAFARFAELGLVTSRIERGSMLCRLHWAITLDGVIARDDYWRRQEERAAADLPIHQDEERLG